MSSWEGIRRMSPILTGLQDDDSTDLLDQAFADYLDFHPLGNDLVSTWLL